MQLTSKCLLHPKGTAVPVTASVDIDAGVLWFVSCDGPHPLCTSFLFSPFLCPLLLATGNVMEMHLDIEYYRD